VTGSALTRRAEAGTHVFQFVVLGTAVAAAALIVGWLVVQHSRTETLSSVNPVLVSQSKLEHLARAVDHPVYWAGPKSGYSYEVTATHDGRFYVRYLPTGVAAGDPRATFLTVGTYARASAFADLEHAANAKNTRQLSLDNHKLLVFAPNYPQTAYFGFLGAEYQVEVYDPSGGAASRLVLAGKIVPVR
jgi:hypothetical protein